VSYGCRSYGSRSYGGVGVQNAAPSTTVQVTPTTTRALIRDSVATAIEGITPTMLASRSFEYSEHESSDFRVWADENDAAVFRQFVIELGSWEPFGVSDGVVQRRESSITVVVAYPHHWALYQREGAGRRSLEDVIERDMALIAAKAGIQGSANYPSGACPKLDQSISTEIGEGVSFGVLEVMIEWYARI